MGFFDNNFFKPYLYLFSSVLAFKILRNMSGSLADKCSTVFTCKRLCLPAVSWLSGSVQWVHPSFFCRNSCLLMLEIWDESNETEKHSHRAKSKKLKVAKTAEINSTAEFNKVSCRFVIMNNTFISPTVDMKTWTSAALILLLSFV